jgi:hypothetical protein
MNADYSQKDYKTQPIKHIATNLCFVFEWNYMDSKKETNEFMRANTDSG